MIKATQLLTLGKEAQDLIQAWIDPTKTKGWISEATDLGTNLWNLQETFPEIADHWKEFIQWALAGMALETLREYSSAGWVEWDLPIFLD